MFLMWSWCIARDRMKKHSWINWQYDIGIPFVSTLHRSVKFGQNLDKQRCNACNLDTPCNPFTAAPWWSTVELSLLIVQAVLWSCYGLQLGLGIQSRVQQKGDERRHRCRPEPKQTSTKSTNNPCNVSGLNLGQWNIIIYPECIIPPFQRRTMRVEHGWATSHSCAVAQVRTWTPATLSLSDP